MFVILLVDCLCFTHAHTTKQEREVEGGRKGQRKRANADNYGSFRGISEMNTTAVQLKMPVFNLNSPIIIIIILQPLY